MGLCRRSRTSASRDTEKSPGRRWDQSQKWKWRAADSRGKVFGLAAFAVDMEVDLEVDLGVGNGEFYLHL